MSTLIIINNAAAKARLAWPIVKQQLDDADFKYDAYETKTAGDATTVTRSALRNGVNSIAVIGGDGKSAAIAAASVIAKETRDRYMRRADVSHPGWEFASHVGYATPEHRSAIERLGISPLHRRSFQSAAYQQLGLAGW